MEQYFFYRDGHLLRSGGLSRQEARYLTAMRLIGGTLNKLESAHD